MFQKSIQSFILTSLMLVLSACDSGKPPELMKAVKQFKSDEIRDGHIKNMRKNHMDELLHKRDETVIQGIRTKKHSLKACINCHVPEEHNGKPLRHSDPEHFCSTCHSYVAQQLDCFQCHADRPRSGSSNKVSQITPKDSIHQNIAVESPPKKHLPSNIAELNTEIETPKQSIGEK
ncbi:MAG: hypothetical protein L3J51_03375 [Cocleimonas sp.]|nr:hypothetical protein [Cocleimonas sp.]